jgi:hypothetical protein
MRSRTSQYAADMPITGNSANVLRLFGFVMLALAVLPVLNGCCSKGGANVRSYGPRPAVVRTAQDHDYSLINRNRADGTTSQDVSGKAYEVAQRPRAIDPMTEIATKLKALSMPSVSLGYRTLHIADTGRLQAAQLGYSRSSDGQDLTANEPGAWQPSWVVIGHEDECGDPIFVDTADVGWPVFTAAHGEGYWRPRMIAQSLGQFSEALHHLKPLTAGRENPMEFERNPFGDVDVVVEKIGTLTGCPAAVFWTDWLRSNSVG